MNYGKLTAGTTKTAIDTAKALVSSLENTDIKKLTLIDIATI